MGGLFTRDEICSVTGASQLDLQPAGISSISIDSRSLGDDALFVAIKGERFNGHDFVRQAIDNGAAAALVSADKAGNFKGLPVFVVPDPLSGLGDLARFARARTQGRIVGVTGSVGKTTTKEALQKALSTFGSTHSSIKSYNNHWGVPLMLAGLPPDANFGIFEMGMNHAGEITPLSQMVRPEIAVITAIAPAHIGYLGSLEAIAGAKAEIFAGMEPGGLAVINADHGQLDILLDAAERMGLETLTYGFAEAANVVISDYASSESGSRAKVGFVDPITVSLPVQGRHMISNAVAAILVAELLGFDPQKAADALCDFSASAGRGRVETLGDPSNPLVLIDESYNANPASMRAALETFSARRTASGRKILVLGDMRELGEQSGELHLGLINAIEAAGADQVFLVGPEFGAVSPSLAGKVTIAAKADAVSGVEEAVLDSLAAGDAVMLKASLGTGLGTLVASIRRRFNRDA